MLHLKPLAKNVFLTPRYPCLHNYSRLNLSSTAAAPITKPLKVKPIPWSMVEARKRNVPQSPWKMNFLVKLVRRKYGETVIYNL